MSRSTAYDRESAETRGIDRIVCHFAASMLTGYGQHGCDGSRTTLSSGNRLAWDVLSSIMDILPIPATGPNAGQVIDADNCIPKCRGSGIVQI